jgi:hypothetical protein
MCRSTSDHSPTSASLIPNLSHPRLRFARPPPAGSSAHNPLLADSSAHNPPLADPSTHNPPLADPSAHNPPLTIRPSIIAARRVPEGGTLDLLPLMKQTMSFGCIFVFCGFCM